MVWGGGGVGEGRVELFVPLLQLSVKCEMIPKKKWSYFGGTLLSCQKRKVSAMEGGRGLMHACMLSCFCRVQLCNLMDCSLLGSSVHGDSPGKNPEVGCDALLQGIFLTHGSNLHLLCLLH